MSDEIVIGSHVHLRSYAPHAGKGIVTDIQQELNGDRNEYTAVYVEYDEPLHDRWPRQNHLLRRGKHAIESLELIP